MRLVKSAKGVPSFFLGISKRAQRRHLLFPCILLVQTLLLTLVFLRTAPTAAPMVPAAPIRLISVQSPAASPASGRPISKPVQVSPPAKIQLKLEPSAVVALPVFDAAAAELAGFGTTCDIAETLARAFSQNDFVKAELARIGPQSRSVANAIMFWDGRWVELPGDAPADAVETLRRAIVEGVEAAPAECMTQEVSGPRFVFVSGSGATMMLVLGSGTWRWEQLLAETAQEESVAGQQGGRNEA